MIVEVGVSRRYVSGREPWAGEPVPVELPDGVTPVGATITTCYGRSAVLGINAEVTWVREVPA